MSRAESSGIQGSYPETEFIIVPKSRVIDAIPKVSSLAIRVGTPTGWLTSSPTRPIGTVGASTSSAGAHLSNPMLSDI